MPSYIKLKRKFANSFLEDTEKDPEEWITELEALKTQMNNVKIPGKTNMLEVDVVIHVMASLPEEYKVAVSILEEKMMNLSDPITMAEICKKVCLRHDQLKKHEEKASED